MTDAPERIWLDGDATIDEGVFPRCFATPKPASDPPMEFIRADLHAAAIARAERAEAALAVVEKAMAAIRDDMRMMMTGRTSLLQKTISTCDATIAKIAALKGGAA